MRRFATETIAGMILVAGFSHVFSPSSWAALGATEVPADSDRAAVASTIRPHGAFTIKELVSNSVSVREYLNRDGTVFGMAWKGRNQPDFESLLGAYYTEYQDLNARSASGPRARGGHRTMQGSRLVIEHFGHMGALKGRAFIPSLMPAGVKSSEIK